MLRVRSQETTSCCPERTQLVCATLELTDLPGNPVTVGLLSYATVAFSDGVHSSHRSTRECAAKSYEYTADEAFIVADLGRAGAIEEPTVACVAQAITHEYDSAAAAVRDVHGIAMWSNSAQEDSVLTALADLCGPQQFAGLYRNMGDGPQYMLFSEVVRPKLSVKAVPPKLSEEDVG
ncbi:hypothetical protein WJX72_007561 [[Myrmecia] bisecta]|uniref:Uncharacterized protein n=1 Tax=[Myrmecia] bisecta TaxID=41462 RepID=A0AAW1R842_9CHLO